MSFRNPTSIKDVSIHFGLLIGLALLLIFFTFYIWMPITTNHGDTITVPDIRGLSHGELDSFLGKRSLRFEITADSGYSSDQPPLTVLGQVPAPNAKVKENRKIYVILNAERPPKVRMPKVIDLHMKSAQMRLHSFGLKVGKIEFKPDAYFGVVIDARVDGISVMEGEHIEKGTVIDLIAGDGDGSTELESPLLVGLDREEATFVIIGSGLKPGSVRESKIPDAIIKGTDKNGEPFRQTLRVSPGEVQQQYPPSGTRLHIGDVVDLWIYTPDSVGANTSNILNNQ